jgi:hypothetical protein
VVSLKYAQHQSMRGSAWGTCSPWGQLIQHSHRCHTQMYSHHMRGDGSAPALLSSSVWWKDGHYREASRVSNTAHW